MLVRLKKNSKMSNGMYKEKFVKILRLSVCQKEQRGDMIFICILSNVKINENG